MSASVRGIGVAVMWRTCGLRPSASAERCSTPKRCCSSTTATARSRKPTSFWISAWVPIAICTSPEAISCAHVGVLLRAERAREQRHPHAELRADPLDGEEVLLGEHLGRRHQRALPSRLDGAQQRRERDDGLAGADVALEQPLHRRRPRQVAVDLGIRLLLRVGEREREHLAVPVEELAGRRERLRRVARAPPSAGERELETRSSSKASRRSSLFLRLRRARVVHRDERIGPAAEPRERRARPAAHRRRRDVLERGRDEGAELLLGSASLAGYTGA